MKCTAINCQNEQRGLKPYCNKHRLRLERYGRLEAERTHVTHGLGYHPLRKKWTSIKQRLDNPNHVSHKNYGGRGIDMCAEWRQDFSKFIEHISELTHYMETGYSLDRIDNDGNYEPGNVRWATHSEQQLNRRDSKMNRQVN
jgi:hypothetical protein